MSKPQSPSTAAKRAFWTAAAQASSEGQPSRAVIETLKNWDVLPAGVQLIEEEHSFDVTCEQPDIPTKKPITYSGRVSLKCRFFLIAGQKIPISERPTSSGDLTAMDASGVTLGLLLGGKELIGVNEEGGYVVLDLADPRTPYSTINGAVRLRTQLVVEA